MIDLHSHTTASDGTFSPSKLIHFAAKKNITVLAITDHDTTSGLAEAKKTASSQELTLVPGIELNIAWPTGEFHLLGLGLEHDSPELLQIIKTLQDDRSSRNEQIIRKMQQAGMDISVEKLKQVFPFSSLGRPHIASFLVASGVCKTNQQAFDKYLGKGRPFYVQRAGADLDKAISAIKSSGGIPVLAHPLSLYISYGKIEPVLANLKERGIQGLEAFHSSARKTDALRLEEIARKIGLFVTGGSDYHGENSRKDRKLGHACNGEKIPERLWTEELLPQLQKPRTSN